MATRLILIRHGQTYSNLNKRYCGIQDESLNRTGRLQAKRLRQRLKGETIQAVYVSDRIRALQTAEIIFQDKSVHRMPDLREINFGIFEGLTHCEIIKLYPNAYGQWLKDPFNAGIPKGENLPAFKKRVIAAFSRILRSNRNRTIAVVSHGGVISAFLNHISKTNDFWSHIPKSAGVIILEHKEGSPWERLL